MLPSQSMEPLIAMAAEYPMQHLGYDLFSWKGGDYVTLVDRFSGYIWCWKLRQTKMENVAKHLLDESFGFPLSIYSDNGPQFRRPFRDFCDSFRISNVASSPYNPASNGLAESAVKICKGLLRKMRASGDKNKTLSGALSAWRNIPRTQQNGL